MMNCGSGSQRSKPVAPLRSPQSLASVFATKRFTTIIMINFIFVEENEEGDLLLPPTVQDLLGAAYDS